MSCSVVNMIRKICLWLLLVTLVAGVRADCDACIAGRCHSRKPLMQGFDVTDQLAVDRTNNVIYVQLDNSMTFAIYPDEPKIQLVYMLRTTGMAVDQATQILYAADGEDIYYFKIDGDFYDSDKAYEHPYNTTSARLHYADVLYSVNKDGSCHYFMPATGERFGNDNLEDYVLTDMVKVINTTTWVFITDNNLYKFVYTYEAASSHLISKNKTVLSTDKYGDVYVSDADRRVIYKLDRITEELEDYASYNAGWVEDFVFDKENNIVFREADGTVARWLPEQGLCYGNYQEPPHVVSDLTPTDYYLVNLPQNPTTWPGASSEDNWN